MKKLLFIILLLLSTNANALTAIDVKSSLDMIPMWESVLERQSIQVGSGKLSIDNLYDALSHCKGAYKTDKQNYNLNDYYATPNETKANGGDCEDWAICAYYYLRSVGFAAKDINMVSGFYSPTLEYHAVLLVNLKGESYVLDSMGFRLRTANDYFNATFIKTNKDRTRKEQKVFNPFFAYNENGVVIL